MRLVRHKIQIINFALILAVLVACEENKQVQDEYVAKVGNTILTKEGLENYLSQDKYGKKFKNEFVRQWIDEELLYQEALGSEIIESKKYLQLIETAQKQIAGALVLEKQLSENLSEPTDNELGVFYNSIRENFRLTDDAYIINTINFDNETSALEFRNQALQTNWNQAVKIFEIDSGFVSKTENVFLHGYQLSPVQLGRIVRELYPNEISLIIQKEPSVFAVVQMVKTIAADTIADFNFVKKEVKEIYYFQKRKELFAKYLDELYSKYKVEIKKVDE